MSASRILTAALLGIACAVASADPITIVYTGSGSGTLGGTPFPNSAYTITAQGDTDDISSCGGSCQEIEHSSVDIDIAGVGTFSISTGLRTFLNTATGLSRQASVAGGDLLSVGVVPGFDLVSDVGPVAVTSTLGQWSSPANINTDAGILIFDNGGSAGTFGATLGSREPEAVPALPLAGLALLAGLLGATAVRRLRR
jgi:hypothetical protein